MAEIKKYDINVYPNSVIYATVRSTFPKLDIDSDELKKFFHPETQEEVEKYEKFLKKVNALNKKCSSKFPHLIIKEFVPGLSCVEVVTKDYYFSNSSKEMIISVPNKKLDEIFGKKESINNKEKTISYQDFCEQNKGWLKKDDNQLMKLFGLKDYSSLNSWYFFCHHAYFPIPASLIRLACIKDEKLLENSQEFFRNRNKDFRDDFMANEEKYATKLKEIAENYANNKMSADEFKDAVNNCQKARCARQYRIEDSFEEHNCFLKNLDRLGLKFLYSKQFNSPLLEKVRIGFGQEYYLATDKYLLKIKEAAYNHSDDPYTYLQLDKKLEELYKKQLAK